MIKKDATVTMHYTLKVDGSLIESSADREPITFVQGEGQIIPGVEKQLEGLNAGDRKQFVVTPEDGSGQPDPAAVHKVPKDAFQNVDKLNVGDRVSGEVGGRSFRARVDEIGSEEVTLDLNHPLAGKTLQFEIEVLNVKS